MSRRAAKRAAITEYSLLESSGVMPVANGCPHLPMPSLAEHDAKPCCKPKDSCGWCCWRETEGRRAGLEEALVDLRGVAETTYACRPPENSEQWNFMLEAITRANAAIGIRHVTEQPSDPKGENG